MAATYEPIATTTLGSAADSISFSSIPNTYTDLRLVIIPKTNAANFSGYLTYNSDTATNYSFTNLNGDGTSATSARTTNKNWINFEWTTGAIYSTPTLRTIDIFSYAGSTYKTCLGVCNADVNGSGAIISLVGLWRSTAAITTITYTTSDVGVNRFASGTTATLYGIKAA